MSNLTPTARKLLKDHKLQLELLVKNYEGYRDRTRESLITYENSLIDYKLELADVIADLVA